MPLPETFDRNCTRRKTVAGPLPSQVRLLCDGTHLASVLLHQPEGGVTLGLDSR